MNFIYRANKWLDNSNYTILILITPIIIANLLLTLTDFLWLGVSLMVLVGVSTLVRIRIQTGQIKFDRSKYDIPAIGETVIIKKTFYWNGSFHKSPPDTLGNRPWYYVITGEKEYNIVDVKEIDGDWVICIKNDVLLGSSNIVDIKYFESRKYWETKSSIRNNKLNKLGI